MFGGLIFGGDYTWRSLFSEFYGNINISTSFLTPTHFFVPGVLDYAGETGTNKINGKKKYFETVIDRFLPLRQKIAFERFQW